MAKYRCKEKNAKLWQQCQEALAHFTTPDKLDDMFHTLSSQKNESFNRVVMRFAPKEICLGKSMSLTYRICVAIGVNSIGHMSYLGSLLVRLGLRVSTPTRDMLCSLDQRDAYFRVHNRKLEVKKRRSQLKNIHWRLELARSLLDIKDGAGYGQGKNGEEGNSEEPDAKKMRAGFCGRCQLTTHLRTSSRLCPFNKKNLMESSTELLLQSSEKCGKSLAVASNNKNDPPASLLASACQNSTCK